MGGVPRETWAGQPLVVMGGLGMSLLDDAWPGGWKGRGQHSEERWWLVFGGVLAGWEAVLDYRTIRLGDGYGFAGDSGACEGICL